MQILAGGILTSLNPLAVSLLFCVPRDNRGWIDREVAPREEVT